MIEEFINKIEKKWHPMGQEPILLSIIGSTALFLQTNYIRGTKDTDILEVSELPKEVWEQLRLIGGKDSDLAKAYRFYIDLVGPGLPFLPPRPLFHLVETLNSKLKFFRFQALDPVDVVVSKLKTFRPSDLDDIRAMADRHLINPARLVERFECAKEHWLMGSRAHELRDYIKNLHTVQRDYLMDKETPIFLPRWLDQ